MPPERFTDPGLSLYELATHFVVECPKCQGKALVASKEQSNRLSCTRCFHVEQPGHWYGAATAYVSVKCRECHAQIRRSAPWDGVWKKLATRCGDCGDHCEYEASISYHPMHQGRMTDSVFGLPLWLQAEWREELIWAFHDEHLEILQNYVAAKHRERSIELRKNRSIVNRLPVFMTKAANRAAILAVLADLQKK